MSVVVVACQSADSREASLTAQDSAAIRDVRQAFVEAELKGSWRRQASLFSEEGALLESRGPAVVGRSAIRAGLEEFDVVVDSFELRSLELAGNGLLAVDRGTYTIGITHVSGVLHDSGWYLMVLERDRTLWRIAALTHDSEPEATSASPDPAVGR